jgi:hypothetical protein
MVDVNGNTLCAKETVTVMTGVLDLHFKARILTSSSPANMDVVTVICVYRI